MPRNTMSQLGRPKLVAVRRPVIASVSPLLRMMFEASEAEILAVKYCAASQRLQLVVSERGLTA